MASEMWSGAGRPRSRGAAAVPPSLTAVIEEAVKANVITPKQSRLYPFHLLQVLNAEDAGAKPKLTSSNPEVEAKLIEELRKVTLAPVPAASASAPAAAASAAKFEAGSPPPLELVHVLKPILSKLAAQGPFATNGASPWLTPAQRLPNRLALAARDGNVDAAMIDAAFKLSSFDFQGPKGLTPEMAASLLVSIAALGVKPPGLWRDTLVKRSESVRCLAPGTGSADKRDLQLATLWATLHLGHPVTRGDGETSLALALSNDLPCPELALALAAAEEVAALAEGGRGAGGSLQLFIAGKMMTVQELLDKLLESAEECEIGDLSAQ